MQNKVQCFVYKEGEGGLELAECQPGPSKSPVVGAQAVCLPVIGSGSPRARQPGLLHSPVFTQSQPYALVVAWWEVKESLTIRPVPGHRPNPMSLPWS